MGGLAWRPLLLSPGAHARAHAVAVTIKRGTFEVYLKWLVANKRKTGALNYSKAITFGSQLREAGQEGDRQEADVSGNLPVWLSPSSCASNNEANQHQSYPNEAQLHNLYPALYQPSVAHHQTQLGPLYPTVYNAPRFPFHGAYPYLSTLEGRTQNALSQAAPRHRSLSTIAPP